MRDTLVLVPGIDGTGLLFYRQVPLLERRYDVTTTRLRDNASHMGDLVQDLHDAVTKAAPDGRPVTVLGESFGGALAMSYAVAHPDRVRRLVILNSFAHIASRTRLTLGYHFLRVAPWGWMRMVRRIGGRHMHSPQTPRDEIRKFHDLMSATTRSGYLSRLRILQSYDLRPRLGSISAPVLFLAADRDHLVPSVAQARLMQALTPGSTLRVLEGHGHSCLAAPDLDLSAIMDDWIREPERRTS